MPRRHWRLAIQDIIDAIHKIQRYVASTTFEDFCADEKTTDAVMYNITIIGEATRHIPAELRGRYKQIPWRDMRDIRNVVIHEYFGVDLEILWDAIHDDLPPLVPLLQEILEQEK